MRGGGGCSRAGGVGGWVWLVREWVGGWVGWGGLGWVGVGWGEAVGRDGGVGLGGIGGVWRGGGGEGVCVEGGDG